MRKILFILIAAFIQISYCNAQCNDYFLYINFDSPDCLDRVMIDTVADTNNIWQVGDVQKTGLDSTACQSIVIATDTANPYPVNDTSSFSFKFSATEGIYYGCKMFTGSYYVQSDSLNDYGLIEFSPDNGTTWIDIMNDTAYSANFICYMKPVLTGHSVGCRYFDFVFGDVASVFSIQIGDTLQMKFTFISDSIFDNECGLMFDNFQLSDFVEGMTETRFRPVKSIVYPNPVSEIFTIEFDNPDEASYELAVYDIHSKLILKMENISFGKIQLESAPFKPGIYVYKLTNLKETKRSWGKFVVPE